MKNLKITVDGVAYNVQVEELDNENLNNENTIKEEVKPNIPKINPNNNLKDEVNKQKGTKGAEEITAPMPGTIVSINVSVGKKVSKGDVLLILEAMKMENEIVSPKDGVVSSIDVEKGKNVESGELLVSLN